MLRTLCTTAITRNAHLILSLLFTLVLGASFLSRTGFAQTPTYTWRNVEIVVADLSRASCLIKHSPTCYMRAQTLAELIAGIKALAGGFH